MKEMVEGSTSGVGECEPMRLLLPDPPEFLLPSDLPEHPLPSDLPERPLPSDLPERPLPSDLPERPLPSDLPERPLPSDLPERPLLSDLPERPLPSDLPERPLPSDLLERPLPSDLPERPLLPDPLERPLLSDLPEHPLLPDPLERPLLSDPSTHPLLPDPPERPLLSDPSKHPLLPDPPGRPLDSDCCGGGCIPCVMDIYREELALWEADCQRLLAGTIQDGEILEQQELMLHHTKYTRFPIQDIKPEAVDCVRIRCGLARHQTLSLSLGQHIIVRSQVSGSSLTRQYTPVSPLDAKGYFELLIKIYPAGRMSHRIAAWKVGHKLEARGPAGQLAYVRNKFRRVLMLCAGTGVAPMCQVAQSVLADANDETFLRLVYACRSYHHLMAKSEIQEWQRFWNFSCLYVLSQEPMTPTYKYKRGEEICCGHIDKEIILREMAGGDIGTTLVLICGPRSFNKDMMTYLTDMGVPETNIHQY